MAHKVYMTEVKQLQDTVKLTMYEKARINPQGIPAVIEMYRDELQFKADPSPHFIFRPKKKKARDTVEIIERLAGLLRNMEGELKV